MTLYFKNPGVADMRAMTVIGVNAKEGDSPIGYFGSGFKNAVAIILRAGGSVYVEAGPEIYSFVSVPEFIRSKEFNIVHLKNPDGTLHRLGFTTDIGKNWDMWMAYRELRSNMMDEAGSLHTSEVQHTDDETVVIVDCLAMEVVHSNEHLYFCETRSPLCENERLEIYRKNPDDGKSIVFYRGIRVAELVAPSCYHYNIKSALILTEDRTVAHSFYVDNAIRNGIAACRDKHLLRTILTHGPMTYEYKIDYSEIHTPSEEFLDVAEQLMKSRLNDCNPSLRRAVSKFRDVAPIEYTEPLRTEAQMLKRAEEVCLHLGMNTANTEIRITNQLGKGTLGMVHNQIVYLSKEVFDMGTKMVAGTLYEEMCHIELGYLDETRAFQNFLLNKLMTMYENLKGEAL